MLYHLDEPQADPAPLNVLMICKLAREHGIKVLLSGAGGDDLFSGYRRHYALAKERYWQWLPTSLRRILKRSAALLPQTSAFGRRAGRALGVADGDAEARLIGYFRWLGLAVLASLWSDDLRDSLERNAESDPLLLALRSMPTSTPGLNRMLYLEQKYFLGDHNLNYTDKMSMASGVEVRVPFLDPDLVQFAAGPGQVDLEESHGRLAAAVDYLPAENRLWRTHTPLDPQ